MPPFASTTEACALAPPPFAFTLGGRTKVLVTIAGSGKTQDRSGGGACGGRTS